ncbi:MAG: hypothetical protein WCQ61_07480 [Proteiniphilum sp.]
MNSEKSEQILEAIEDERVHSLQKKHGKKIITLGNPRSDSKDLENLFMDNDKGNDK